MSKKRYIQIIALLSMFVLLLSCCFAGCSRGDGGVYDPSASSVNKLSYDGIHDYTAPDTSENMVTNGSCDYSIVLPEIRSSLVNRAKDEFVYLFREATGITLPVLSDSGLTHNSGNKYISIGETELLKSSGIRIDREQLTDDGVRIVTKDKSVYLCGGSDYGTIYAVYDFMQICFGFDCYYQDCFDIQRNVQNLKLKAFNVTDIPDLEFRSNGIGAIREMSSDHDKDNWKYRFRQPLTYGNKLMPIHEDVTDSASPSKGVHNSLYWLPPSKWMSTHEKWFSQGGADLCYTAHGDEAELTRMIEECARVIEAHLVRYPREEYPLYNIATLTCQDNFYNCTCEACEKERELYGSYAGSVIKFMNRLSALVREWMAKPENADYAREDFSLAFFAYHNYELAPVKVNEATGEYEAVSEDVYLDEGVSVFLAPSRTFDFMSPIYADINADGRANLESWAALGGEILLWTYSTNFWHYFYPCDTFNFYNQDAFEYFAANNVVLMFNQNQGNQGGASTAWNTLKTYLDSKLEWDTSLDAGVLIDKYMNAMYGDAADLMKTLFLEMRMQSAYVDSLQEGFILVFVTGSIDKAEYWPYPTVMRWLDICDEAYAVIENSASADAALREKIKRHIDLEWLSPAYMAITLYDDIIASDQLAEIKSKFKEVVEYYGITRLNENGTITGFINSL